MPGQPAEQRRLAASELSAVSSHDTARRDAGPIWCGEVSKLKERLTTIGGRLNVERAPPVGAPAQACDSRACPDRRTSVDFRPHSGTERLSCNGSSPYARRRRGRTRRWPTTPPSRCQPPRLSKPVGRCGRATSRLARSKSKPRARTERLVAFFHYDHSSSVLLKAMLDNFKRSSLWGRRAPCRARR
jgi:hypothetical protein